MRLDSMDLKPKVIALSEFKPKHFRMEIFLSEYNNEGYTLIPLNLHNEDP